MNRHRRRRSSFARRSPPRPRLIALAAGAVVLVALFVFFVRQADVLAPEPAEIRTALRDAFKE